MGKRIKFDLKAVAFVFLGYSVIQNGYKVMTLTTNQLFVSRDVVFHEFHLPFHTHAQSTFFLPEIYLPSVTFNTFDDFVDINKLVQYYSQTNFQPDSQSLSLSNFPLIPDN